MALFDRFKSRDGKTHDEREISRLIQALASRNETTAKNAAAELLGIGTPVIPQILKAIEPETAENRARIAYALASRGIPAIPFLLHLFLQADPEVRDSLAGGAVAGLGKNGVDALNAAIKHDRPSIRQGAAIALRGMGKKAVPALATALHDRDPKVRQAAAESLASMKCEPESVSDKAICLFIREEWQELLKLKKGAVPVLIDGLGSPDFRIRRESARTLGKIRDPQSVPELMKATNDPVADVRMGAVEALGELRDERARSKVQEMLSDAYPQVRLEAAWALDRYGWRPETYLQQVQYLLAKEQWSELAMIGKPAIQPLIAALQEGHSGVRTGALEALERIGKPAYIALQQASRSNNPALKKSAESALEHLKKKSEQGQMQRPATENQDRYAKEYREAMAVRERFEKLSRKPSARKSSPEVPQADRNKAEKREVGAAPPSGPGGQPQAAPEEYDLEKLLLENRKAMRAWSEAVEEIKIKSRAAEEAAPESTSRALEEFLQVLKEQEGDAEETPEVVSEEKKAKPDLDELLPAPEAKPLPARKQEPEEETLEEILKRHLRALQDSHEEVRATAVDALRSIGKPAVDFLILALQDKNYVVRIAAADALGAIGDSRAVDPCIRLLSDGDEDVRIAGARALSKLRDSRAIPHLVALLGDSYHGAWFAAADALAVFKEEALDSLFAVLNDPLAIVRVAAIRALGKIGNTRAIPPLIGMLGDPVAEVRWSAAQALGDFGTPAISPILIVLKNGSIPERLATLDALWKIPDERSTEAIISALDDPAEEVRTKASEVLKKREILDVWRRTWGERMLHAEAPVEPKTVSVRETDEKAFKDHGRKEVDRLILGLKQKSWKEQLAASTRLVMMGKPAVEGLIKALRDEDPEIQKAAADIIGEMREVAVEPLMDALRDQDKLIRVVAARNLGKIGSTRSIETLIEALHTESESSVRSVVAEALGYMGNKLAVEPLVLALRDRDESVQIAAARSLGYIGSRQAIGPLIQALNDVDSRVRSAALEALKDPDGSAQEHLFDALKSGEKSFKSGVAEALDRLSWQPKNETEKTYYLIAKDRWGEVEYIGAAAFAALAETLDDPSTDIRINAVKAISRIGGTEAVAPLIRALRDDHFVVRMRAERSLAELGEPALEPLSLALADGNEELVRAAQRIIEQIREASGQP